MAAFWLCLTAIPSYCSSAVRIKLADVQTAPVPNVLVIVQSLSTGAEVGRKLTNQIGTVEFEIGSPGLFRLIATSPFGLWGTTVREFRVVPPAAIQIDITLKHLPPAGNRVYVGSPITVTLVDWEGKPLKKTNFLTRSEAGCDVQWHTTDENGSARVDLLSEPVVVVVEYNGKIHHHLIGEESKYFPAREWCDCRRGSASATEKVTIRIGDTEEPTSAKPR
jgi:hypothetical protein